MLLTMDPDVDAERWRDLHLDEVVDPVGDDFFGVLQRLPRLQIDARVNMVI